MRRIFYGHHKCATNWIFLYCKDLCERFDWRLESLNGGLHSGANPEGKEVLAFYWNTFWKHVRKIEPADCAVHSIRDPRDALVSGYWSWKSSHRHNNEQILSVREKLNSCSLEDGLIIMIDHIVSLDQLDGWDFSKHSNILTVRYENLLYETESVVSKILEHWKVPLSSSEVKDLIDRHSFKAITGRSPGQENTANHYRKGIAGDWKNYFTERVTEQFKKKHSQQLIALGYETSDDWSAEPVGALLPGQ